MTPGVPLPYGEAVTSVPDARIRAQALFREIFENVIPLPVPIVQICRQYGIQIWRRPMATLDALSFLEESGRAGILLNSRIRRRRANFSLAHEMGHIFLGHASAAPFRHALERRKAERAADVFAAEITMPQALCDLCRWTVSNLSVVCNVSRQAAEIRLREWRHPD